MSDIPCVHVLTVHWQHPRWIEPQHQFLNRHLKGPQRRYAFLTGIEDSYQRFFDEVDPEPLGSHAKKLNRLAQRALVHANDDDILLFIDGDAFPVAALDLRLQQWLADDPLVAVQRLENNGDPQPHPCFCATRARFWREIEGDWRPGYHWTNHSGESVTDVGARLLQTLQQRNQHWTALKRSNQTNLHPLWFGVYGDAIYHHGAGFRAPVSRIDLAQQMGPVDRLIERLRLQLPDRGLWLQWRERLDPINRFSSQIANSNQALAETMYQQLLDDPDFYRQFM